MNDAILLAYTEKEFERVVRQALSLNSRHKLLELSESPLAQTSLVEDCFLEGETVSALVRGRTMQAVLHWGIDQLRPTGEQSWTERNWKDYNVLFYPYMRGMTFAELQKHVKIVQEKTLFESWRPKAIGALATLLYKELKTKANLEQRQAVAIKDRCARHSADERTLLDLAAIFREKQPIGQALLYQLAGEAGLLNISGSIGNLLSANLWQSLDDGTKIELHPAFHRYLQPLLSPDKRQQWHHAVGIHYQKEQDYLEAAYHFRRMENNEGYALAAQTLVNHQSAIINQQRIAELSQAVAQFRAHELAPARWCQLKIVAGDIALDTKEIESAIAEYGQALQAKDIQTKALAYYRRAKAYKGYDIDQALAHYKHCIELLSTSEPSSPLVIQSYIDKGWIFIQHRPNLEQGDSLAAMFQGRRSACCPLGRLARSAHKL